MAKLSTIPTKGYDFACFLLLNSCIHFSSFPLKYDCLDAHRRYEPSFSVLLCLHKLYKRRCHQCDFCQYNQRE